MKNRPHSFFIFMVAAIASAAFTYPAHAGQYELIKGKGVEVCEAYEKNLNSIPLAYPMICERKINPKLTNFKEPDWVQPDLAQVRALEFDRAKLGSKALNQPEPKSKEEISVLTEKDEGSPVRRWIAQVDIDNDGTSDTVLKQQDGNCPMHRAFEVHIAVVTKDGKHYDLEKSQYIDADYSALFGQLNKDPKPWDRRTAGLAKSDFIGYSLYDIFLYKETTYFDLFEMGKDYPDPRSGRLHVFLRKNNKTQEICTYGFAK